MNETSGNVSIPSGRFILDAINATRALNDPGLAGFETPTPDVLAKRPPRFVERRSLLPEERGAANASLARAIETAGRAVQELDALWVPIIKSWRLNERMYGALTGLSKKAILGEHGADSA